MNTCVCGNPAEANGALCSRCAALRVLELAPDSTASQIKDSYHVLVKVWHPDRFQGDRALMEAAEAKLKEINSAYRFLTSPAASARRRTRPTPGEPAPANPRPQPQPAAEPYSSRPAAAAAPPARPSLAWVSPALGLLFKLVLVAVALLLCRYLWIAFDVQDSTGEAAAKVYEFGKDNVAGRLDAPKRRFLAAIENDLGRLGMRGLLPAPAVAPQPALGAPPAVAESAQTASANPGGRPQPRPGAAPRKLYPYITVGSTRDEVLGALGPPAASTESKLVYGRSELDLKDNAVVGWRIDPVVSPIRVKLWPDAPVDPDLASFTVGSTRDVVLVVQGTPTAFSDDKFEYGGSAVYFQNRRVVRWKNDPASIPLRVRTP